MKYTISKATGSYNMDGSPEFGYSETVTAQSASSLLASIEKMPGRSPIRIIRQDGVRVVISLEYNPITGKSHATIYSYPDALRFIESGELDHATCTGI